MAINWFVSVDDHLIEPARLWQERLPERWRETGPRIVRDGDSEFWVYEDRQIVTTGLNAVAGKRREEFSPEPITYEDMRPGCYEPAERVADMDQGFVLSSLLFPSFPRYCGQVFHEAKDKELALLCVQAWNDFILEEFAGDLPGPVHPDDDHPAVGPGRGGGRDRAHGGAGRQVDRLLREPDQAGPAVHPHRLLGSRLWTRRRGRAGPLHARRLVVEPDPHLRRHADAGVHGLLGGGQPGRHAARLAVQRQLRAVPRAQDRPVGGLHRLDPVLPGAGRAGRRQAAVLGVALRHRHEPQPRARRGEGEPPPSTWTPTSAGCSAITCTAPSSRTRPGLRLLDIIGEDNVMLECDYPHSDSTWPDSVQLARKWLGHLPEDVQHKIAIGNAARVYNFTPADPDDLADVDVDVGQRSTRDDPARRGHRGRPSRCASGTPWRTSTPTSSSRPTCGRRGSRPGGATWCRT